MNTTNTKKTQLQAELNSLRASPYFNQAMDRCFKIIEELRSENKQLRKALERIANTDFRGNRSSESQIAHETLIAVEDK